MASLFYGFQSRGNEGRHDFCPGFLRIRYLHNHASQDLLSTHPTPITTSDPLDQCQPVLTGMKSSKTQFLQDLGGRGKKKGGQPTKNKSMNHNKQITSDMQNPFRRDT